jgi:hypothetical protein
MGLSIILSVGGCEHVTEPVKTLWGSSTRALEEARAEALSEVYSCKLEDCFEAVVNIAREEEMVIFINDRVKKHIVLMGVKGSVDTTEVGVFFSRREDQKIKVEVSSLSRNAKRTVAGTIFPALRKIYPDAG